MQVSSKFTLAIHILIYINTFSENEKITSNFLAKSTNTNPVIIRNILLQLKVAKIITISQGVSGITIIKQPQDISLLDIYKTVETTKDNQIFNFHKNPNQNCLVGKNIHNLLDEKLDYIQNKFNDLLSSISLLDLINDFKKITSK